MTHQDVKPWEPVRGRWQHPEDRPQKSWRWQWINGRRDRGDCGPIGDGWSLHVTLANGQTVIVKAKA